ncbi:glutamate-1-semialdehyde 2,1-aminomutase [Allofrancisella guangzhouensis]|uniref:Glutamate-1-semialdehyde 2,1-aminomutase n=1 Tax=Allofrancisella guangzhouensis TaxID=594679 RepID=A0A0A8E7N1_9GAMM|nr:glutamate-1-semialdehyde 2,1-aminomutase [Allofrancisella guangzhouensis]
MLRKKAASLIPGGAHTYSKGDDQFPELSPHSIVKGIGARVWDVDGNEFIDWGMGLTSVILGHAYKPVVDVIKKELDNGVNFIRPSFIEAEVAEFICEQIPSAEMVKFAKNGSNATTSAVKLARAYTGKELVLRCVDQPFFSIDDWFIGNTDISSGVTKETQLKTKRFKFNDIKSLEDVIDEYKAKGIACVILEPAATDEPIPGYLQAVKDICEKEGIVLIFDEVVSGFRFHPKGAQYLYGVTPHLSTFGKAMANGYSISALVGKKEIMQLGGLDHDKERVFLLSTTYGGETHHLRAAQKTIEILNQNDYQVTKHIWGVGAKMKDAYNQLAKKYAIDNYTSLVGVDCRPYFYFKDNYLRTLFQQEMIKRGVLVQAIVPSYSHQNYEVNSTTSAFDESLKALAESINNDTVAKDLVGSPVKPVFRKYN